jgi:hypothetical protein
MNETITYVGLDVHKETIVVALADGGSRGDVRSPPAKPLTRYSALRGALASGFATVDLHARGRDHGDFERRQDCMIYQ